MGGVDSNMGGWEGQSPRGTIIIPTASFSWKINIHSNLEIQSETGNLNEMILPLSTTYKPCHNNILS